MVFRKTAAVQVVILALICSSVALLAACPKKDALRSAIDASYRLPATTNDLIRQIREGRDRGIISTEQASRFGDLLNKMATAEVVYVDGVKALKAAVDRGDKIDKSKLSGLQLIFDRDIVGPFLDVLSLTKLLSGSQAQLILLAVDAARLLLRTIGGGIGSQLTNALAAKLL